MSAVLTILFEVTVYSTVLWGAILLFRAIFQNRISAKLQYLVWLVLIARLLLPVTAETGFHFDFLRAPQASVLATEADSDAITAAPSDGADWQTAPDTAAGDTAVSNPQPQQTTQKIAVKAPFPWRSALVAVWALGVVAAACRQWLLLRRFSRRLTASAAPVDAARQQIFDKCRQTLATGDALTLLLVKEKLSPALTQLGGRTVLILPEALDDARTVRYAILHELVHNRRRDHWMCRLLGVLRCVYWYHPLVYLAFAQMQADMETACDADVLQILAPTEKRDYLMTLLRLFSGQTQPSPGFAQYQTRRLAKQRVKGAFMKRRTSIPMRVITVVLVVALVFFCFTTACQSAPNGGVATAGAALATNGNAYATAGNATGAEQLASEKQTATSDMATVETPNAILAEDTVTVKSGGVEYRYTVMDLGVSQYSAPYDDRTSVVSPGEAARSAAALAVAAFQTDMPQKDIVLVTFVKEEYVSMPQYQVSFGGDGAGVSAMVDAQSGEALMAFREYQPGQEIEKPEELNWDDLETPTETEWMAAASSFMNNAEMIGQYKNATILDDSHIDGVQATFRTVDPVCADAYLHMSEGPCYTLRIHYPSMTVTEVFRYPMGWNYCKQGTFFEEMLWENERAKTDSGKLQLTNGEYQRLADAAKTAVGTKSAYHGASDFTTATLQYFEEMIASLKLPVEGIRSGEQQTVSFEVLPRSVRIGMPFRLVGKDGGNGDRTGICIFIGFGSPAVTINRETGIVERFDLEEAWNSGEYASVMLYPLCPKLGNNDAASATAGEPTPSPAP